MNIGKYLKIVSGLLLIAIGGYTYTFFWQQLVDLIKGGFGLVLILLGILAILMGATD